MYSIPAEDEFQSFTDWISHEDSIRIIKSPINASPLVTTNTRAANIEGATLKFGLNDRVQSYTVINSYCVTMLFLRPNLPLQMYF